MASTIVDHDRDDHSAEDPDSRASTHPVGEGPSAPEADARSETSRADEPAADLEAAEPEADEPEADEPEATETEASDVQAEPAASTGVSEERVPPTENVEVADTATNDPAQDQTDDQTPEDQTAEERTAETQASEAEDLVELSPVVADDNPSAPVRAVAVALDWLDNHARRLTAPVGHLPAGAIVVSLERLGVMSMNATWAVVAGRASRLDEPLKVSLLAGKEVAAITPPLAQSSSDPLAMFCATLTASFALDLPVAACGTIGPHNELLPVESRPTEAPGSGHQETDPIAAMAVEHLLGPGLDPGPSESHDAPRLWNVRTLSEAAATLLDIAAGETTARSYVVTEGLARRLRRAIVVSLVPVVLLGLMGLAAGAAGSGWVAIGALAAVVAAAVFAGSMSVTPAIERDRSLGHGPVARRYLAQSRSLHEAQPEDPDRRDPQARDASS